MPQSPNKLDNDKPSAVVAANNQISPLQAKPPQHITVFGAGSWGTALALHLARNKHNVTLWGRDDNAVQQSDGTWYNHKYLPDAAFPNNLTFTAQLNEALERADWLLISVPSSAFADTLATIIDSYKNKPTKKIPPLAWATKGLHNGQLLHNIAIDQLGRDHSFAVMSGPTFAGELAKGLPTALTVAGNTTEFNQNVADALNGQQFRAYTSEDYIGVEIGGAVKNVLAVAAGASDGLGFGANARTALVTRGLAEMARLGKAMGADADTFMGLAGLGDLVLTCTDNQSRNRRFGLALAEGVSPEQAKINIGQAVEGEKTTAEIYKLAQSLSVDMPITEQVWQVLNRNKSLKSAVNELINRPNKAEFD